VRLVNVETGDPVELIPAGAISLAYQTSAGGRSYWMTAYSVSHGIPHGIRATDLDTAQTNLPPLLSPSLESLPASLRGAEWTRIPTDRRVVALTFDGGANNAAAGRIISALAAAGAPATFFLTGNWADTYPADARRIGLSFSIANHSYSHASFPALSDAAVVTEIDTGASAIQRHTGGDPSPLFRFPYGARDERTIALVNQRGYGSIRWTVDTLGWEGAAAGHTADSVIGRVLGQLTAGEIVLMHLGSAPDGSTLDADALTRIISEIRARGYQLVSLREFL
jgi:peptidoglycan/xylan/chitin deacetylase (PgdA/CDA1 family)